MAYNSDEEPKENRCFYFEHNHKCFGILLWRNLIETLYKKDKKLPVVLSKEEKDLRCLHKYKTQNPLLILMYSSELKVGEVVRLKPKNIDSERILIHIKGSKRRKDRYTILSRSAMVVLKKYYAQYKPRR